MSWFNAFVSLRVKSMRILSKKIFIANIEYISYDN